MKTDVLKNTKLESNRARLSKQGRKAHYNLRKLRKTTRGTSALGG